MIKYIFPTLMFQIISLNPVFIIPSVTLKGHTRSVPKGELPKQAGKASQTGDNQVTLVKLRKVLKAQEEPTRGYEHNRDKVNLSSERMNPK